MKDTMPILKLFVWTIFQIQLTPVFCISELKAAKKLCYKTLTDRGLITDKFTGDAAYFHHIPGHTYSNEIYLGARNRLYSVTIPYVSKAQEVVQWKPTKCTKINYKCAGSASKVPNEFVCGNHIRMVLAYNEDKRQTGGPPMYMTVCGSHGGDPKCQIYRRDENVSIGSFKKPQWSVIRANIFGHGVVNEFICPREKNPFYFNESLHKLFVSSRTSNGPAFVSFRVKESISKQLHVSQRPFFTGSGKTVSFHSMFRYNNKVFILFNEEARESDFNGDSIFTNARKTQLKSRKKRYARVARVCFDDQGSDSRRQRNSEIFTTFFKARLLCRSPNGLPFDYLVAVSEVNTFEPDPLIRGIFAVDDGLTRAHAVCAFRASDMEKGIEQADFVNFIYDKNGLGSYMLRLPSPLNSNVLTKCRKGRTGAAVSHFVQKYPLRTDPILNDAAYPWKAFISNSYNITTMVTENSTGHEVIFLGTDTGAVMKLGSLPKEKTATTKKFSVIEELQLFPTGVTINALLLRKDHVLAVSDHEVRTIPIQRCSLQRSCRDCNLLGDPHCSWNPMTQRCTSTSEKFSSVQAAMEYCDSVDRDRFSRLPVTIVRSKSKKGNESLRRLLKTESNGLSATAVGLIGLLCSLIGFASGCLIGCFLFKRFGDHLPTHLLNEIRQRNHRNLGNEKASAGPKGVSSLREVASKADCNLTASNEYDNFLDHPSPPASAPLSKKLNNDMIKNNLMASLNHHKSIDNFL